LEAILALEDGRVFRGESFGAKAERTGEVVFNTSMAGYQEVVTDPSYRGQIVAMTCPEIGNYGTNSQDQESTGPQVEGFVVRQVSSVPSNWRANQNLPHYLRENGIPGIADIDTRALTRHIRTRGAMKGIVSSLDRDVESLVRKAREAPGLDGVDLVARVTCETPHAWDRPRDAAWRTDLRIEPAARRYRCVAYDFGIKQNILQLLAEAGFDTTVVPASFAAADTLAMKPDVVFLSNGPGDPAVPTYARDEVGGLIGKVPIFGICLGHQILGLALGGRTVKLKFGHRGANHPVKDLRTSKIAVTSQNHGYAVDPDSLPPSAEVTHINLNDGTCEGFVVEGDNVLAVQYHPESSPGPHDALDLFGEFRRMADRALGGGREDAP